MVIFSDGNGKKKVSIEEQKQDVFNQLKLVCLPLLNLTKLEVNQTTSNLILVQLESLNTLINSINLNIFTPVLGNYIFFPISNLLQPLNDSNGSITRSDVVLESTMKVLLSLIKKWRNCTNGNGMDFRILNELWIMSILSLGGPLDPSGPNSKVKGKGKEVEKSDELKLAILEVLIALIKRVEVKDLVVEEEEEVIEEDEDDDDFLGENIDWTVDEPGPPLKKVLPPSSLPPIPIPPISPPIPILFHTLTTLLSISSTPTSLINLQLNSLVALRYLLTFHLIPHSPLPSSISTSSSIPTGPSSLLATALPGTASTLSRIALSLTSTSNTTTKSSTAKLTVGSEQKSVKRQPTKVIISALEVLSLLIISTVADEITSGLRKSTLVVNQVNSGLKEASLEEVFENFSTTSLDENDGIETTSSTIPEPTKTSSTFTPPTGPTLPTTSWLIHTLAQISVLLKTISTLLTHEAPLVRQALAKVFSNVLKECSETLAFVKEEDYSKLPIEGLLLLSSDDWIEVSSIAKSGLLNYLSTSPRGRNDGTRIITEIVQNKMSSLPSLLVKGEESKAINASKIVIVALELSSSSSSSNVGNEKTVLEGIEKWSWNLLKSLGFERVPGIGDESKGGMELAWITGESEIDSNTNSTSITPEWPTLSMKHLKSTSTQLQLIKLFKALGKWSLVHHQESIIIEQFLGIGLNGIRSSSSAIGGESSGVSALWILDGILTGLSNSGELIVKEKSTKKVVRGVVRRTLELLKELEDDVEEEIVPEPTKTSEEISTSKLEFEESNSLLSIEHQKGISLTPSLDTLKPISTTSTSSSFKASNRLLLAALSLRILSTCSTLLGTSFQPHLLLSLYHLLSHLSPTSHPLLRSYSQIALARIAISTSYASIPNLLLSNVDYILNSVSQRLSISTLSPSAPLVLVEMIRLTGKEVVPFIGDLIEDCFEVLDDFHGYDGVTVGLWGVLDAVVRVLVDEVEVKYIKEEGGEDEKKGPNNKKDWELFENWFKKRNDPIEEEEETIDFGKNPQKPFESFSNLNLNQEEEEEGVTEGIEGGGFPTTTIIIPPTKSQILVTQILSKSIFFLSHSSPFLRSRVLSLLSSAVPLLSNRTIEEDPNSSRQSDLLNLVHRSWPFILNRFNDVEPYIILEAVKFIEALSLHVGEYMSRRILDDIWPKWKILLIKLEILEKDNFKVGLKGNFTISHQIQLNILKTLTQVIKSVPVKEEIIWEMGLKFRNFLNSSKVDKELSLQAKEFYIALGKINQDAIWLILSGSLGEVNEGLPEWLKLEGEIKENVEYILERV